MAPGVNNQKTSLTNEHKAALAVGREQSRAIRRYLEASEHNRPKRGRKRTAESIAKRLEAIERQIEQADVLTRVQLYQERMDLRRELESKKSGVDLSALEEDFIAAAAEFGKRKGIGYQAWREAGVDPAVLRRAGISRSAG
jgi:uncharacterized protein YicC (UPF0701 family)